MNYGVGILAIIAAGVSIANLMVYGNDGGGLWTGALVMSLLTIVAMAFF